MPRPQQASKYVRTLRQKHPTSLPLMLMHGHVLTAQVAMSWLPCAPPSMLSNGVAQCHCTR